jgi:hypothetical protein
MSKAALAFRSVPSGRRKTNGARKRTTVTIDGNLRRNDDPAPLDAKGVLNREQFPHTVFVKGANATNSAATGPAEGKNELPGIVREAMSGRASVGATRPGP